MLLELDVGPVAHGGHCVARHEGRVVFVRHALPGERVRALVTDGGETASFWRADAVDILSASADRVSPPCPYAGPARCGGCDWQHASLPAQRALKAAVIREQLRHLAGLDLDVVVEPVPGDEDGLGWRTRVSYAVDAAGVAGLHPYRSHDVLPVERCLIAHPAVQAMEVTARRWPGATHATAVATASGDAALVIAPAPPGPRPVVTERAAGRDWRLDAAGFWQTHPGAADALVAAVRAGAQPRAGETVLDLYAGVGLFAGALAGDVGGAGRVVAVEGDRRAVADARTNLRDLPQVRVLAGRVDRVLRGPVVPRRADIVVLDPPRRGAGGAVCRAIAARRPRAVAYVACDPAALARDIAHFAAAGYALRDLRAYDLFPMTHHVECVGLLGPQRP